MKICLHMNQESVTGLPGSYSSPGISNEYLTSFSIFSSPLFSFSGSLCSSSVVFHYFSLLFTQAAQQESIFVLLFLPVLLCSFSLLLPHLLQIGDVLSWPPFPHIKGCGFPKTERNSAWLKWCLIITNNVDSQFSEINMLLSVYSFLGDYGTLFIILSKYLFSELLWNIKDQI